MAILSAAKLESAAYAEFWKRTLFLKFKCISRLPTERGFRVQIYLFLVDNSFQNLLYLKSHILVKYRDGQVKLGKSIYAMDVDLNSKYVYEVAFKGQMKYEYSQKTQGYFLPHHVYGYVERRKTELHPPIFN